MSEWHREVKRILEERRAHEPGTMECQKCGECCTSVGRPLFVRDVDSEQWDFPNDMPEDLRTEFLTYMEDVARGAVPDRAAHYLACYWWDSETRLCKHYDYRPPICCAHFCGKDQ